MFVIIKFNFVLIVNVIKLSILKVILASNNSYWLLCEYSMHYPNFIDDTEFIKMDCSTSENEQLRAMLDNLTQVHLLTAKKYHSFDGLIREYLQCGIHVFGLETGIVSHIDENHIYHVMDVISPLDVLEKGLEFPLSDTYCKEVFKTEKILGFPHVGNLDFMHCHPVYVQLKLEAYLSAPIYVEDKLYGTFNFTSLKPRTHGFSNNERNLIELMANAIGNFILLRSKEESLLELNDKLKLFVGFVSHDLRSPIAEIIGLSRLLISNVGDEDLQKEMLPELTKTAESALELVGKILNTSALSTGKMLLDKLDTSLQKIMDDAKKSVIDVAAHRGVSLHWDLDANLHVFCDSKMITQAMTNLLVNAIKYSPIGSQIQITAHKSSQHCNILIENALGMSDQTSSSLPSVYHSVGFGLDIVDTIIRAHDTELEILKTETKFSASFMLDIA